MSSTERQLERIFLIPGCVIILPEDFKASISHSEESSCYICNRIKLILGTDLFPGLFRIYSRINSIPETSIVPYLAFQLSFIDAKSFIRNLF